MPCPDRHADPMGPAGAPAEGLNPDVPWHGKRHYSYPRCKGASRAHEEREQAGSPRAERGCEIPASAGNDEGCDTRPYRGRALAAYAVSDGVASPWGCPGPGPGRGSGMLRSVTECCSYGSRPAEHRAAGRSHGSEWRERLSAVSSGNEAVMSGFERFGKVEQSAGAEADERGMSADERFSTGIQNALLCLERRYSRREHSWLT